jgi:hypothetical protein
MTRWCNRRTLTAILLIVGAGMLQGCVYNPYTGTYTPCCAYPGYYGGYPYAYGGGYSYPANGGYYSAPAGYQGQYHPPVYQGQGYQGQGYQGRPPPPPPQ